MSGHSKWAQIKHAKAATDKKKGLVFSKIVRQIAIAVRDGGIDPAANLKLRLALEKAREAEMPKDNIERAIEKASGAGGGMTIEQVSYEGFGPYGTAFIIDAATDSKNRTTSNIRHIFEKFGGTMGQPGSVSWNFEARGQILAAADEAKRAAIELAAIDAGAEDVRSSDDGLEIYTAPADVHAVKLRLQAAGAEIVNAEIIKEAKNPVNLSLEEKSRIQELLHALTEDEDVIAVHTSSNL